MKKLYPLAGLVALLALLLLLSSWRTLRALDEQREVYLRSRAAALAGRLESQATEIIPDENGIVIIAPGDPGDIPDLAGLWNGRELYRTMTLEAGERVFRAYVTFHSAGGLRIARIDIPFRAADFLVVHARRNVLAAGIASVALLLLTAYGIWSARRAAELERRQLALAHLAQIGEMASVLAHEIRNPLGTIKGYAQLLAERADAESRRLVDPIVSQALRLEGLVTDLLAYGRPPQPKLRPVACREILAAAAERPEALVTDCPNVVVRTDPDLVGEILINLIRNAAEAAASRIEVRAWQMSPHTLQIEVADNGQGIPDTLRARIFEPFFTTKPFGTGLGLAISDRLARSLGGDLRLLPGVAGGTRAILRLPVLPGDAEPAAERRLDGVHSGSG